MDETGKISRRDFIKFLGAGAVAATLGKFVDFSSLDKLPSLIPQASAQASGSWALGPSLSVVAIHAAMLKNGKIMYAAGSGYHTDTQFGPFKAAVYDPATGIETVSTIPEDLFCCGFCQLANGNILVAGGTKDYDTVAGDGEWHGLNSAYEYDPTTNQFYKVQSMAHGRWYPTLVTLQNGKAMVVSGFDEFGTTNALTEIYDPVFKNFSIKYDSSSSLQYCVGSGSILPGAGTPCYGGSGRGVNPYTSNYPRMHLMPSGLVFKSGQARSFHTWNSTNGNWVSAGTMLYPNWRTYGCSVLLPLNNTSTERGRILLAGGSATSSAGLPTNTAEIVDFNAGTNQDPVISFTASMTFARLFALPVILPTGKVVVFGGTNGPNTNPVFVPEQFDPVTNTWTQLPAATVPRWYHSTSLLLPDGRVWIASGTPDRSTIEPRIEIFSPGYLFAGTRPTISGNPVVESYGGTIVIPTPDASTITSVSLVRLGTPTHHFDSDQRLLWLQILSSTASSVTVAAPLNANLAPPGYYMIHVINNSGIPSVSKIVKIPTDPVGSSSDHAAPYVGILTRANTVFTGPSGAVPVSVNGTAFDVHSGIQSVVVGFDSNSPVAATPRSPGDWSAWSFSGTISTAGTHTVKATATDNAGNKSSATIPIKTVFG